MCFAPRIQRQASSSAERYGQSTPDSVAFALFFVADPVLNGLQSIVPHRATVHRPRRAMTCSVRGFVARRCRRSPTKPKILTFGNRRRLNADHWMVLESHQQKRLADQSDQSWAARPYKNKKSVASSVGRAYWALHHCESRQFNKCFKQEHDSLFYFFFLNLCSNTLLSRVPLHVLGTRISHGLVPRIV